MGGGPPHVIIRLYSVLKNGCTKAFRERSETTRFKRKLRPHGYANRQVMRSEVRKEGLSVHIREVVGSSPSPPVLPPPVSAWYAFWAVREDIGSLKRRTVLYLCPHGWAASREEKRHLRRFQHWLRRYQTCTFPTGGSTAEAVHTLSIHRRIPAGEAGPASQPAHRGADYTNAFRKLQAYLVADVPFAGINRTGPGGSESQPFAAVSSSRLCSAYSKYAEHFS